MNRSAVRRNLAAVNWIRYRHTESFELHKSRECRCVYLQIPVLLLQFLVSSEETNLGPFFQQCSVNPYGIQTVFISKYSCISTSYCTKELSRRCSKVYWWLLLALYSWCNVLRQLTLLTSVSRAGREWRHDGDIGCLYVSQFNCDYLK
jgi:hypothetical protein